MNRRLQEVVDRDHILESATLESEISMSIAATDETHDAIRYRQPPPWRGYPRADATAGAARGEAAGNLEPHQAYVEKPRSKRFWGINVEPAIFMLSMVFGLILPIQPLFLYWARCIEIFSDRTNVSYADIPDVTKLCLEISNPNNSYYQNILSRDIATAKIYLTVANGIPTLITSLIIGVWSDGRGGRRRPLLLSLFGFAVHTGLLLCATLTYKQINVYILRFAAEIAIGCTGGFVTLFTAAYSIVIDESRHQMGPGSLSVPIRIGVATATQSFGNVAGYAIASLFTTSSMDHPQVHDAGYIRASILAVSLAVFTLLYTFVFVRETHHNQLILLQDEVIAVRRAASTTSRVAGGGASGSYMKYMLSYFYEIFEVLTKPRGGWVRFCLNLSVCFVFIEFLALDNELLILFVKNPPYEWSDTTFAHFALLKTIAFAFGTILTTALISKAPCLGQDSILVMIGVASSSLQFLTYSLAPNSLVIFIAGAFSLPAGALTPGYRSFLPRMVAKEETSRLFTAMGIIMIICPILAALIFNNIFNATLEFWPGFTFLVDAIFQIIVFIGQIVIHFLMWPQWKRDREERLQREKDGEEEDEDTSSSQWSLERPDLTRTASNTAVASDSSSPNDGIVSTVDAIVSSSRNDNGVARGRTTLPS